MQFRYRVRVISCVALETLKAFLSTSCHRSTDRMKDLENAGDTKMGTVFKLRSDMSYFF
jgi:hypothetical protein